MKIINFNPTGSKLWVEIDTGGLYAIAYNYELLESDSVPTGNPAILTNPMIAGDNLDGVGKYYYQVINNYQPNEPLNKFDTRYIYTYFFIKILQDDAGFNIKVSLLQGDDYITAINLGGDGNDPTNNTVGSGNSYSELNIEFEIQKKSV